MLTFTEITVQNQTLVLDFIDKWIPEADRHAALVELHRIIDGAHAVGQAMSNPSVPLGDL
jgi:hypothetical protein